MKQRRELFPHRCISPPQRRASRAGPVKEKIPFARPRPGSAFSGTGTAPKAAWFCAFGPTLESQLLASSGRNLMGPTPPTASEEKSKETDTDLRVDYSRPPGPGLLRLISGSGP